jgi:hypothetical protein
MKQNCTRFLSLKFWSLKNNLVFVHYAQTKVLVFNVQKGPFFYPPSKFNESAAGLDEMGKALGGG